MPTICTPICNDSIVVAGEGCDDGNGTNGDGCSATCAIELGYACTGAPSVCTSKCGDGVVLLGETCDDGNNFGGDGCSTVCTTENGFNCPGSPSVCSAICGDGKVVGFEDCDDGNTTAGDGCNPTCNVELSYGCTGTPSVCSPIELEPNNICANASGPFTPPFVLNGRILPAADLDYVKINVPAYADLRIESFAPVVGQCTADPDLTLYAGDCTTQLIYDDLDGINFCALINPAVDTVATNLAPGSYFVKINEFGNNDPIASYQIQFTFTALCGNGILEGTETCDDGNLTAGDGCGNNCRVEQAWQCTGTPSVCTFTCGNGVVNATEQCDDGNINPSDGCNGTCNVEAGYICAGMPSVCVLTCGNGALDGTDQCDDGNTVNGDGCSSGCTVELNHKCTGIPSVCPFVEQSCNDGTDNDGDGMIDAADTDCQVPAYFPACAAGQMLRVIRSVDIPKSIPDSPNTTGVTSNLYVGTGAGTIVRAAMLYNITHTWDSDLDLTLVRPNGTGLDVCSGNGSSGDNYTNTVLDSTCISQVTGGTAPFSGCYQPETPFTTFVGASASGLWKFKAVDHAGGDVGTINSWAMIFCTTP
jgi:cysteine-rich repeat protein